MSDIKRKNNLPACMDGQQRILNSLRHHYQAFPPRNTSKIHYPSIEKESDPNYHYQRLIAIYQEENQSIQQRNLRLLEEVRETKEREMMLLAEIAELQQYHKKLVDKENEEEKQNFMPTLICPDQKTMLKPPREELQALNQEFQWLIEASIGEEDLSKRKKLRKQLATLAKKIKNFRLENDPFFDQVENVKKDGERQKLENYLYSEKKTKNQE